MIRTAAAIAIQAAALAALAPSPAPAAPATQQRAVSGFTGLGLSIPARVEIVQGEAEGITLSGDEAVLAEIVTEVDGSTLRIRWKDGVEPRSYRRIAISVKAKAIDSIAISGSGEVLAPALQSKRLAARIAGSGEIRVAGRAEALEVRISGSGNVDASRLETMRTTVRIAGSGDAMVWAREALDVNVSGSGDVRYYGDPRLGQRIAGSGSVRRAGASPG